MGRADDLAQAFEAANNEFIEAVEGLSEEQWRKQYPGEERRVGVVAHHVGYWYPLIAARANAIANGETPAPLDLEGINAANAEQARQNEDASKHDTINLLRSRAAEAADMVRGLSDEQLGRRTKVGGQEWTAEQVIERVLIGHPAMHLEGLKAAKGA